MDRSFDPYYIWLGIPPEDQPPNHYRLLGVKLFESNPDVLQSAADRQMVHLRTFQMGKHSAVSQKLLNEVSAARVCLLNVAKKAAYDAKLQAQLATTTDAIDPALAAVLDGAAGSRSNGSSSLSRARGRSRTGATVAGIAAVGLVVVLVVVGASVCRNDSSPSVAKRVETAKPASPRINPRKVATKTPADVVKRPTVSSSPSKPAETTKPADGATVKPNKDDSLPKAVPRQALPEIPRHEVKRAEAEPKPSPDESADNRDELGDPRLPVPAKESQDQALRQARALLESEAAKATTADAKRTLATKVVAMAREPQRTPDSAFALFSLASELAVAAADGETVVRVIDASGEMFRIDVLQTKGDALKELAKKVRQPADHASLADVSLDVSELALDAGRFELATDVAELAKIEAGKGRDKEQLGAARARLEQVQRAAKAYPDYAAAMSLLEREPDEPNANRTVGGFLCFIKVDWEKGLPRLAKCGDSELQSLAKRDVSSRLALPVELVKIADAWWAAGRASQEKFQKDAMLLHAGDLYERARPWLSATDRLTVEKRLKEIAKLTPQDANSGSRATPNKKDAVVTLKAESAVLHGSQIRLDQGPDNGKHVTGWVNAKDWLSWSNVKFPKRGVYEVSARVATPFDGAVLAIGINGANGLAGPIPNTGGFGNFGIVSLGTIKVERTGDCQIGVLPYPLTAKTWRPIDLASVTFRPAGRRTASLPDRRKAAGMAFADDLEPKKLLLARGQLGKHGEGPDPGTQCKVKGVVPSHALCAHPVPNGAMVVIYTLDARYRTFKAATTIADQRALPTPLRFRVVGDGKLLWQSKVIKTSADSDTCNVSVASVRTLILEVDCAGPLASAWAVWVEPCLSK
ncbi:MAG: NPCBM/NEW2 domain-containing protein [Thermoguttaceae bacterium]